MFDFIFNINPKDDPELFKMLSKVYKSKKKDKEENKEVELTKKQIEEIMKKSKQSKNE